MSSLVDAFYNHREEKESIGSTSFWHYHILVFQLGEIHCHHWFPHDTTDMSEMKLLCVAMTWKRSTKIYHRLFFSRIDRSTHHCRKHWSQNLCVQGKTKFGWRSKQMQHSFSFGTLKDLKRIECPFGLYGKRKKLRRTILRTRRMTKNFARPWPNCTKSMLDISAEWRSVDWEIDVQRGIDEDSKRFDWRCSDLLERSTQNIVENQSSKRNGTFWHRMRTNAFQKIVESEWGTILNFK